MPLSEDEQRILQDIERSFYENDPAFARAVSRPALYRHAARNCKLAVAGFVIGFVVLLVSFTRVPAVAFIGFVAMVACSVFFAQNLRRIGAAGLRDVAESEKGKQVNDSLGEARNRLRNRFRREQ